MRCLHFITCTNPFGPKSGDQLRAFHILRALEKLFPVKLLLLNSWSTPHDLSAARAAYPDIRILHMDQSHDHKAFRYVRRNISLYAHRSSDFMCREKEEVHRSFSQGDVIWSFGLRAAACLGLDGRHYKTFIDVDSIPSQIIALERPMERRSRRMLTSARVLQWRVREWLLARVYAGVGVCSEIDRRYLGGHPAIHVIPNGFSPPQKEPLRQPSAIPYIGFIGNISYEPNAQGLTWFISEVWPRVKAVLPSARFRVIGGGGHNVNANAPAPDIDFLGYVEDPAEEIATWSMMIVPILVGGGTRIKIAESFARKCPVVSTPVGAYGLEITDGRELRLAQSAGDFAVQCLRVIARPDEASRMADVAYAKFLRDMTWDVVERRVEAAVRSTLIGV